jgi:two-component system chemotaxis response regulator CheY
MKILLVDDSRTMRNIQKKVLEQLGGVEFTEAGDGVEALSAMASGGRFDLVLVDWNMPNMDGHTFVTRVRANDKATPMIMCTTEAEKGRVVDALKAGVNNYVVKPFTPETLLEKVKTTLAKIAAARAAAPAPMAKAA